VCSSGSMPYALGVTLLGKKTPWCVLTLRDPMAFQTAGTSSQPGIRNPWNTHLSLYFRSASRYQYRQNPMSHSTTPRVVMIAPVVTVRFSPNPYDRAIEVLPKSKS